MFMNGQKRPDKQASASHDINEDVEKKKNVVKKSSPSVEISKMKGSCHTGLKAPKFNDQGACARCKHTTLTTESITCELCDGTFHACCREKNGYSSSTAICTPTFHEKLMPVMTKYGSANAQRWGNLFFICNSCNKNFKSYKRSLTHQTSLPSVSGKTASAKLCVEVGTVTDMCDIPTDAASTIGVQSSLIPAISTIVTKNVETMFGSLQESLLSNIEDIIADKFRFATPAAAPLTSSTFMRRGSSDSTTSSDSCYSSIIGQPAPSMMSPPGVIPPSPETRSPEVVSVESVPPKAYNSFFTNPLHQGQGTPNVSEQPAEKSSTCPEVEMSGAICEDVKDHVIVLNSNENTNLEEAEKYVEQALKNVPLQFLRTNKKSKKIIVSCPSECDKTKAKSLLAASEIVNSHKMTVQDARKMLPKVTVANIPKSILSPLHEDRQSTSPDDYRARAKELLTTKFLEKNSEIEELVLKCTGGRPTEYTVFFLLLSQAHLALQSDYLCISH